MKTTSQSLLFSTYLSTAILPLGTRHGYLSSTLPACRAVAQPHIKLEIYFKYKYLQMSLSKFCHNYFVIFPFNMTQLSDNILYLPKNLKFSFYHKKLRKWLIFHNLELYPYIKINYFKLDTIKFSH